MQLNPPVTCHFQVKMFRQKNLQDYARSMTAELKAFLLMDIIATVYNGFWGESGGMVQVGHPYVFLCVERTRF